MIRAASVRRVALLTVAALLASLLSWSAPAQAQQRVVPSALRNVQLIPGDGQLTLTWEPPRSWGSFPGKEYQIDIAAGSYYNSPAPPSSHSDSKWQILDTVSADVYRYDLKGTIFPTITNPPYRHLVANGNKYHLRIRAVSAPASDLTDTLPSMWTIVSGTPGGVLAATPPTLTVPIGSRACYLVSPLTRPTEAVGVTADTSVLSSTSNGVTTTYATLTPASSDTAGWGWPGSTDNRNHAVGAAFCVKGVTATPSPLHLTHTVASDDSTYNGTAGPVVSLLVVAADTKPTVRFLHTQMRVIEGDTPSHTRAESVYGLGQQIITVKLDIAPAPTSSGHIIWHIPQPNYAQGVAPPFYGWVDDWTTNASYNIDYEMEGLLGRRVYYTAGSNDMSFEFTVRADNWQEEDERLKIYLVDSTFSERHWFRSNNAVCVGSCSDPARQTPVVVTILDDDDAVSGADPDGFISGPGVEVSATQLEVAKGGSATYTVKLEAPPTDIVTVNPAVADSDTASVSPSQLLFSQGDWQTAQTVTVNGIAAGETSVLHTISTLDPAYRYAILPTVAVTVSEADGSQGAGGREADSDVQTQQAQQDHSALVAQLYEWRNDPQWRAYKSHTDRWDRALLAFGETVADTTLTAMTAAQAQQFADRGWARWVPVAAALADIENSLQPQQPPQPDPPPNAPPRVAAPLADAVIADPSGGTHQADLSGAFDDPDGDSLAYTASSSDESVATAAIDGNTLTITAAAAGTATITVTASDGAGASAADELSVTVQAAPAAVSDVVKRYDADNDGRIDRTEYSVAVSDYTAGSLTYSQLLEVIRSYLGHSN